MSFDRREVNRALAKCLSYHDCGKDAEAALWAARLVIFLEQGGILRPEVATEAMRFHVVPAEG
jgi:hypothetical protein